MSVSVKEICEIIWSLEDKYQLLTLEADGVKFWQIARMRMYYLIAEKAGVLAKPHRVMNGPGKFFASLNYIKNAFSTFKIFKSKVDVLMVEHPRGVDIGDGKIVDIYTYYLANNLRKNGIRCKSIEPPYLGRHIKSSSPYSVAVDGLSVVAKLLSVFYKIKNKKEIKEISAIIEQEIYNKFDFQIHIYSILLFETKAHRSKYKVAKWFLRKLNPKELYVVVSYGYFHFVKAAKELGIKVIELQHGTYSKYHLGYSYPHGVTDLTYIPDYLYVWNDYWKQINVLPVVNENVVVTGFLYGEEKFKKYKNLRKKKQIVVLSQGVIGKQLSSKLDFIIKKHPEHAIYYKLHPGEYGRWMDYPLLNHMVLAKKVHVVENTDLYKLLAESEFQIGVFSTALFEGMELGCKTILVDLPGIEYMEELIRSGQVFDVY
jgi:hypothetical protein